MPPNVPDQRPGAKDVMCETEAPSPGSLNLVCWANSLVSPNLEANNSEQSKSDEPHCNREHSPNRRTKMSRPWQNPKKKKGGPCESNGKAEAEAKPNPTVALERKINTVEQRSTSAKAKTNDSAPRYCVCSPCLRGCHVNVSPNEPAQRPAPDAERGE